MAMNYDKSSAIELDSTDKQILNILLEQADIAYSDIAKRIFVSAGTVHLRVKRLRELGVLKGAQAVIDYEALGYGLRAFVQLYLERSQAAAAVMSGLQLVREVIMAHRIMGGAGDILAHIVCRDSLHLRRTLEQIAAISGVQRLQSALSLQEGIQRPIYLKDDYFFEQMQEEGDKS